MVRILPTRRRNWWTGHYGAGFSSGHRNVGASASGARGLFHTNFSRSSSGVSDLIHTSFRD